MKAQLTQEAKAALIKAIHDGHEDYEMEWDNNHNEGLAHAISIVESFPTSDGYKPNASANGKPNPTDNWIPCSERLPEKNKVVLVSANDGEVWLSENDGEFGWHGESTGQLITHWQQLPKSPTK